MHHPNIIIQLFAHNNIISVEACLILSLTYKLHTEMIHINLTPNTEEGWADKVLKTNLWPINLDTWAALKASENEIFFVEDDVEPNTEGQFNDIPTKLELRTNHLSLLEGWQEAHLSAHSDLVRTGFGHYYARLVHIFTFYFWRPEGPLWAPRSVGPYGVGRAPTPLMHAPMGHAYGHPKGVPIIGRDYFSFLLSLVRPSGSRL